jgi:hypothetical protein
MGPVGPSMLVGQGRDREDGTGPGVRARVRPDMEDPRPVKSGTEDLEAECRAHGRTLLPHGGPGQGMTDGPVGK